MRFNTRRLLLATTTIALICGYFAWQRRLERINYKLYDAPGVVAERKFWPQPVLELVNRIEGDFGPAEETWVYRRFHERRYDYCDCLIQLPMKSADYEQFVADLELHPFLANDLTRAFGAPPEGWSLPEAPPNQKGYRTAGRLGFQFGVVVTTVYDEPRSLLIARVTNDF